MPGHWPVYSILRNKRPGWMNARAAASESAVWSVLCVRRTRWRRVPGRVIVCTAPFITAQHLTKTKSADMVGWNDAERNAQLRLFCTVSTKLTLSQESSVMSLWCDVTFELQKLTHSWPYSQALCAIHLTLYMPPITSENWSSFQRRLLTWQPPWGQCIHLLNGKHCGCNIWTQHVMHLWYVNSTCIEACLLAEDWKERGKSSCKFYIYGFCRTAWKQSPVV